MTNTLQIKNLTAQISDKYILKNINLNISKGEVLAVMGKNGSGKSTLAQVLMGNPNLEVSGSIIFENVDILSLNTAERASLGIFLAFQYPIEIPGVNYFEFLRLAYNSIYSEGKLNVFQFRQLMRDNLKKLHIEELFMERNLNEGFSGGEKKKAEILQMFILKPKLIILDETDSGLDRDSLRTIFDSLKVFKSENPDTTILIISHYARVFEYLVPDRVCIIESGELRRIGGKELIEQIEEKGYGNL